MALKNGAWWKSVPPSPQFLQRCLYGIKPAYLVSLDTFTPTLKSRPSEALWPLTLMKLRSTLVLSSLSIIFAVPVLALSHADNNKTIPTNNTHIELWQFWTKCFFIILFIFMYSFLLVHNKENFSRLRQKVIFRERNTYT